MKKSKIQIFFRNRNFQNHFSPRKNIFFDPHFFLMKGWYENSIRANVWSVSIKSATGIQKDQFFFTLCYKSCKQFSECTLKSLITVVFFIENFEGFDSSNDASPYRLCILTCVIPNRQYLLFPKVVHARSKNTGAKSEDDVDYPSQSFVIIILSMKVKTHVILTWTKLVYKKSFVAAYLEKYTFQSPVPEFVRQVHIFSWNYWWQYHWFDDFERSKISDLSLHPCDNSGEDGSSNVASLDQPTPQEQCLCWLFCQGRGEGDRGPILLQILEKRLIQGGRGASDFPQSQGIVVFLRIQRVQLLQ